MKVSVSCTHCQAPYQVDESLLGQKGKCKQCRRSFLMTAAIGAVAGQQPATRGTDAGQKSSPTVSPPRTTSRRAEGEKIGRFEIRGFLGSGGFGEVYRAFDTLLKRDIALKLPHPGLLTSEADRARLMREPQAAAQLRHPNIVPIYDAGEESAQFYIAAAFIDGRTLADRLDDNQRPYFQQTAKLVISLAEALDYAHEQGIVHRDVKPANIMLDQKGEPLLMDFGLARLREAENRLTHDGAVLGTPAYMSPEQAAAKNDDIGPASDQYSLGVVLYELLCGERPFSGAAPAALVALVISQEPESPRVHNPAVPKDLQTICLKAMAKDRIWRYASCKHLADDLRRWLDNQPIRARRASLPERFVRWCKREPVVSGLAAAVVAVFLAGFLATAWQWRVAQRSAEAERIARKDVLKKQKALQHAEETARHERDEAVRQRDLATRTAYSATMAVADRAATDVNIDAVRVHLTSIVPQGRAEDLRGWEWYFSRGSEAAVVKVLPEGGYGLRFSPNNKYLAALDSYGVVSVWKTEDWGELSGLPKAKYSGGSAVGAPLAWSPDGSLLAVGHTAKIIAIESHQVIKELCVDTAIMAHWLGWSHDGRRFATASSDKTINIWNTSDWSLARSYAGHTEPVRIGTWGFEDKLFISGQLGTNTSNVKGVIKIWDAETGDEIRRIERSAQDMALDPTGARLVVPVAGGTDVECFDVKTGALIQRWQGFNGGIFQPAWNANGDSMAYPDVAGWVTLRQAKSNFQSGMTEHWMKGWCYECDFSRDGRYLAVCDTQRTVIYAPNRIGSTRMSSPSTTANRLPELNGITFAVAGRYVVSSGQDGTVRVWNAVSGDSVSQSKLSGAVAAIASHPTENQVVAAPADGSIVLLKGESLDQLSVLTRECKARALCWPAPGGRIIAGGADGGLYSIDPKSGRIRKIDQFPQSIALVSASSDGARIGASDKSGTTRFYTESGKWTPQTIELKNGAVTGQAWSPDGERLLLLGKNESPEVWETDPVQRIIAFNVSNSESTVAAWSPDGRRIAVSVRLANIKDDYQHNFQQPTFGVHILAADTGAFLCSLYSARHELRGLAWSPNGRQLAAAGKEGVVWVWDATPGYDAEKASPVGR